MGTRVVYFNTYIRSNLSLKSNHPVVSPLRLHVRRHPSQSNSVSGNERHGDTGWNCGRYRWGRGKEWNESEIRIIKPVILISIVECPVISNSNSSSERSLSVSSEVIGKTEFRSKGSVILIPQSLTQLLASIPDGILETLSVVYSFSYVYISSHSVEKTLLSSKSRHVDTLSRPLLRYTKILPSESGWYGESVGYSPVILNK